MLLEILTVVIIIWLIISKRINPTRPFPEGPFGLPIFGYLPFIGPSPHKKYNQLARKYGAIYSVNLGLLPVVVLNDFNLIQKAFRTETFSGRPESVLLIKIKRDGIVYSEGRPWNEQRRFMLRTLKDLGFGKSSLEDIMRDELQNLVHYFGELEGQSIGLKDTFEISLINTIWRIVAGERHSLDDPEIRRIHRLCYEGFIAVSGFVYFMPWLAKLAPNATGLNKLLEGMGQMKELFYESVNKRSRTRKVGELTNFIDYYLQEIEETTDPSSSFYKDEGRKNLVNVMINLFTAGSDTSSSLLSFTILYLLKFPKVLARVQLEIDTVLNGNTACLKDLDEMPYTEATLSESMRYSSIVSGSLLHSTTEDTEFEGYALPKGTIVMANLHYTHFDPAVWGADAAEFRPSRFLGPDGAFRRNERLVPFSVGKRVCPAIQIATSNLFIFLTGLLQSFEITADPGLDLPSLDPKPGLVLSPQNYKVILKKRVLQ